MPTPAPRLIAPPLISASRTTPRFGKAPLAQNQTPAQAAGRAYEKKVAQALYRLPGTFVERNPWYAFCDHEGDGLCSPDVLLCVDDIGSTPGVLIIEVKRTWVPDAAKKLSRLYAPVIQHALAFKHEPYTLIICKNLTPETPKISLINQLSDALIESWANVPILQWLGQGDIPW